MTFTRVGSVGLAGDWLRWQRDSYRFLRENLDCFRCGCASDTVLGGCDFDEPRAGLLQANGAGGGALLRLLVGRDFAGAASGSGSASFDTSGRIARGGDCVGRVGGCGKAAGDWLVESAKTLRPDDAGGFSGWK